MRAAVVGGGLAGCASAVGLQAVGIDTTVFEAAPGPRRGGGGLSLFPRGTAALGALGIDQPLGVAIKTVTALHHRTGRVLNQMDLNEVTTRIGYPYAVASRDEVLDRLLDRLDTQVIYGRRCVGVSVDADRAGVCFEDGERFEADLVVAADGAGSRLRNELWPQEPARFLSVAWQSAYDGPSAARGSDEVTLLWGRGSFAGLFPETGGHLGWFLDRREASPSAAGESNREEIVSRFGWLPSPFLDVLASTPDRSIQSFPIYVRRPPQRFAAGRVAIVGDAAHTVSPSAGQGASEAFNDAVALAYAMGHKESVDSALNYYTRLRRWRSTAIWRISLSALKRTSSRVQELTQYWPAPMSQSLAGRALRPGRLILNALDEGLGSR